MCPLLSGQGNDWRKKHSSSGYPTARGGGCVCARAGGSAEGQRGPAVVAHLERGEHTRPLWRAWRPCGRRVRAPPWCRASMSPRRTSGSRADYLATILCSMSSNQISRTTERCCYILAPVAAGGVARPTFSSILSCSTPSCCTALNLDTR